MAETFQKGNIQMINDSNGLETYGKELIIDLHDCDQERMNRRELKKYFEVICEMTGVTPCKRTFWDYHWWPAWVCKFFGWSDNDRIWGTSVVQFIMTSNITVHTIYNMKQVYVNVFSCDDFDSKMVTKVTRMFFNGIVKQAKTLERI